MFQWDARSQRYRDTASGRFVPAERVARAVDVAAVEARHEAERIAQRLVDGKSTLAQFQRDMAQLVKDGHLAAAVIGRGGADQMTQADYGWAGQRIRTQYDYLRNFVQQIADGTAPLDGRLVARAGLYGDAIAPTHREMVRRLAIQGGAIMERNVLGPADHCGGCLDATAQGWVPVGFLPPVGGRICRSRCKCSIETWDSMEAAA